MRSCSSAVGNFRVILKGLLKRGGIVVLEPDAVKVASPVLRGGWFSNELFLPYLEGWVAEWLMAADCKSAL